MGINMKESIGKVCHMDMELTFGLKVLSSKAILLKHLGKEQEY